MRKSCFWYNLALLTAFILLSCSDSPSDSEPSYTDNDPRGAVKVTIPHTETYSISNLQDIDWYRIQLVSGTKYKFSSFSTTGLDIDFYLYGPGTASGAVGVEVAWNDDGVDGTNPVIEYACISSGYYYLRVSQFQNNPLKQSKQSLGDYTLIINNADKPFMKVFGGSNDDWANSITQTSDGGYIAASYTMSFGAGGSDALLTKILPDGTEDWSRTFGGSSDDWPVKVIELSNGDIIMLGTTYSFGAGNSDLWLIKTDRDGNQLWSKTIGGSASDTASDIRVTSDGGFIAAGYTNSWGSGGYDALMIKFDSSGYVTWSFAYGGSYGDFANSVLETGDGGFAFAGETGYSGNGVGDIWIVKTNSAGAQIWTNSFGWSYEDWANEFHQTSDGGFILACTTNYTENFSTDSDMRIIKTDVSGLETWARSFSGSNSDYCRSIKELSDGGYIIAGQTFSYGAGESDFWLINTDEIGNQLWSKTYGGTGTEWPNEVLETADGGFVIAGGTESFGAGLSDILVLKTDIDGNTAKDELAVSKNHKKVHVYNRNNGSHSGNK